MPKDTSVNAGNIAEFTSNALLQVRAYAAAGILTTISGFTANNIMLFDSKDKVKDSGHGIATDSEFESMLDEVLPTVKSGS